MDPRQSPYAPGAGTKPAVLAGRDDVLERFDVTLSRLESGRPDVAPVITGPRGSGKTVLLNELVKNAGQRGWFAASDEVIPGTPLSSLIAVQAHEILLEMSRRHRVAANVKRVLGILKAFTSVSALGISLSIDADAVTGTADTGIFSRDLRRLFLEIGELARQQSVGVAFALDEVHTLDQTDFQDLNAALHQTAQRELPVVFIGAGLFPSWQRSGSQNNDPVRPSSYSARISASTYVRLDPLDAEASARALAEPAWQEQAAFTDAALHAAGTFCQGNAWIIQLLGAEAWAAAARSPIDLSAVTIAMGQVRRQLNQWFFPRLVRNCSDEETRLLARIADQIKNGAARFESMSECSEIIDADGIVGLRYLLSRLGQRDLIELEYENLGSYLGDDESFTIGFSMPMMEDYFRPRNNFGR